MTDPSSTALVHQAFFGWSYTSPRLDILACSSTSKDDQRRWYSRLEEHIRLEGLPPAEKRCPALSYIDFGNGEVAVLRRMYKGHSEARNNSHALIGPVEVLTPTVALGLDAWPEWLNDRPTNQWMATISASYFADFTEDEVAQRMHPLAVRAEQRIRAVLGTLLGSSTAGLSIIGCPRAERLPLLWAMMGAAETYLHRYNRTKRPWTFSTHEVRHEDAVENLPAVIFLPARPEGTGFSSRVTIDVTPGREPSTVMNESLAADLLAQFLHGATPAPSESVYEPAAGVAPLGSGAVETARTSSISSRPSPNEGMGALGTAVGDNDGVPDVAGHVESLRKANTAQQVLTALEKLATSAANPKRRAALRRTLDADLVNRITRTVGSAVPNEVAPHLMAIAYGSHHTDLQQPDALTHASELILESESEDLARRFSEAARPFGENRVSAAAHRRWEKGRSPAGALSTRGGQHAAASPRKAKRDAKTIGIRVGAVLGALTIAFLLGIIVGTSDPEQNDNAQPDPTTFNDVTPVSTSVAPPAPPKSAALPSVGSVTLRPSETEQVFSFVQIANDYYPQSPCVLTEGDSRWQCTRTSTPPDAPATEPSLLAFVIPKSQAAEMQRLAVEGKSTTPRAGWHDEKQVKTR